jgi:outer membrane receptor protein involved in Fe transport
VTTAQLSGRHLWTALHNGALTWQFTGSKGTRYEPDTREVQYERSEGTEVWYLADETQSGSRIFNDMKENSSSLDLNWLQPISPAFNIKVGASFSNRDRNSNTRFFQFEPQSGSTIYTSDPESIYSEENLGKNKILIREATRPTDSYTAFQRVRAVYLTTESALSTKLKMVAGLRHESSIQEVTSYELFFVSAPPVIGRIGTGDFLPALTFIYKVDDRSNLRFAVSQTVSRPDFRELSEFEFTDIIGGSAVVGNPKLDRALIRNFDLRFEKAHGEANLLSASIFYKHFEKPIEVVIQPTSQYRISYENAKSAGNAGIELEAIQALGDLDERLTNWAVSANLTLLESTINLADSTRGIQTSESRPLHGQSPYLVNLNLRYRHPVWRTQVDGFLNVFGKRITEVGSKPLPDVYELPHPSVDLGIRQPINASWTCKASVTNILDSKIRFEQGGQPTEEYRNGIGVSFGISYTR